ncbi:MAG: response regulator [Oscillospiraceae bacterium]|jgi:putative two-component system response regulator|nr:response regulator [Oscillospiraceae bacterium]
MERATILFVDDSALTLKFGKSVLEKKYDVITVQSAKDMFGALENVMPQLILLDIIMPDMDGFETIKLLKKTSKTRDIPIIFLTGRSNSDDELKGLLLGAVDYISKPFRAELLHKRVDVHITLGSQRRQLQQQSEYFQNFNEVLKKNVEEKTRSLVNLQSAILQTMADLVERRDGDTGGHIVRTQLYLKVLITALMERDGYRDYIKDNWDVDLLIQSSQLHDIGKIAISDKILKKPGELNEEEFTEMKTHTTHGKEIIEHMMSLAEEKDFLRYAKVLAEMHHEKWDGTGYPNGLSGKDIPLPGRLMAIADVFDALVSERPYKKPFTHDEAVKIILEGKGNHFDPNLVDVFEESSEKFREVEGLSG